jgi:hypothetical protein
VRYCILVSVESYGLGIAGICVAPPPVLADGLASNLFVRWGVVEDNLTLFNRILHPVGDISMCFVRAWVFVFFARGHETWLCRLTA